MSKLSLYIPTKGIATIETKLGTELKALKTLLSGEVPFEDTTSDRENPLFTMEVLEANATLRIFSENPDRITREVKATLDMRGVDQVGEDTEEKEVTEKAVDVTKLSKPKLAEYALTLGITLDIEKTQKEMLADLEIALKEKSETDK